MSVTVYRWHARYLYEEVVFPVIQHQALSVKQAVKKIGNKRSEIKAKNKFIGLLLKKEKVFSVILSDGLSTVESYWCPIKHYNVKGKIYSEPHKQYFDPCKNENVLSLKDVMSKEGIVGNSMSDICDD